MLKKIGVEQLKAFISLLPEVRAQVDAYVEVLKAMTPEQFTSRFGDGYSWAAVYEDSLLDHVTLLIFAIGHDDFIANAAQADDPAQTLLDDLKVAGAVQAARFGGGSEDERHIYGTAGDVTQ